MILVLGRVLFVEQFLKLRHLPSLRLSVFVFVPKQKEIMVALFTSDMLHDFGFVFNF